MWLSVLFSAAALAGVAAYLWYQARQTQTAQEAARRDAHRELVILALGDASLLECWEPPQTPMTAARRKQILFTNLIVSNWESDFRLGSLGEAALRDMFDGHFQGEIADERYALAVAAGSPVIAAEYFETAT
ncbi:DUF6082 family protein [Streptomyces sp. CA-249302]|uniref:DUF6082 family protein n=1 Tax=Streptomyces sp. CA-249302 TaxID=3240058 RepID=UPI003D94C0B7